MTTTRASKIHPKRIINQKRSTRQRSVRLFNISCVISCIFMGHKPYNPHMFALIAVMSFLIVLYAHSKLIQYIHAIRINNNIEKSPLHNSIQCPVSLCVLCLLTANTAYTYTLRNSDLIPSIRVVCLLQNLYIA